MVKQISDKIAFWNDYEEICKKHKLEIVPVLKPSGFNGFSFILDMKAQKYDKRNH